MTNEEERTLASLAWPMALLGVVGTLAVLLHGDGHDPGPALPIGALAIACGFLLRSRGRRLWAFAPLCVGVFVASAPWTKIPASDPTLRRDLLLLRLVEGVCFVVLLMPVVLASLRAYARSGSVVDAALQRSPWVIAAGAAPAIAWLSSTVYSASCLIPDARGALREAQWDGGVDVINGAAVVCALGLAIGDVMALTRANHLMGRRLSGRITSRSEVRDIEVEFGTDPDRATRALVVSVGIDVIAVATALGFTLWRLFDPPD